MLSVWHEVSHSAGGAGVQLPIAWPARPMAHSHCAACRALAALLRQNAHIYLDMLAMADYTQYSCVGRISGPRSVEGGPLAVGNDGQHQQAGLPRCRKGSVTDADD